MSSFPSVTHFLATTQLGAETLSDGELSPDSLFDEPRESSPVLSRLLPQPGTRTMAETSAVDLTCSAAGTIARRSAPPIPGLFVDPSLLLPADLADSVLRSCMKSFFDNDDDQGAAAAAAAAAAGTGVNQVMLFGRAGHDDGSSSAFPPFLNELLAATSELLAQHPTLSRETHAMLFPPAAGHEHEHEHEHRARQAIVNLYRPGEGISPHVDLLRRFGDGIVGVSLGDGGVAMRFARASASASARDMGEANADAGEDGDEYEVWLPSGSVLVLTGEARYNWTHGIAPRLRDKVEVVVAGEEGDAWTWQERGVRVSVTFRWLLPGADIVGGGDSISDDADADAGRWDGGNA